MELISVIVPIYNTGQYLERCVNSILAQDYPSIEIILVDDGSSDEQTINICDELACKYENVATYHKSNGGSASARNYGIEKASGSYIGFIDSDDYVDTDMFSTLYQNIIDNNVHIALSGIETLENDKPIDIVKPIASGIYNQDALFHHFFLGSFHSACTILYDSNIIGNTRFPEHEINEDYMFNYWIFQKVDKVFVNESIFYHYIRRTGSNTGSPITLKFLDWIKHTSLVLQESTVTNFLVEEAYYQYYFSNIVLANKSILTLVSQPSEDADTIYSISSSNLTKDRKHLLTNKYITGKYRLMATIISCFPKTYKFVVLNILKFKYVMR